MNSWTNGSMLFLDTLVIPLPDGSLETTVNRKPTHTDQYPHWDSHHTISAKCSMVSTLYDRTKAVYYSPQLLQKGEEHLLKVLSRCKYPMWALNRIKIKNRAQTNPAITTEVQINQPVQH